jgi:hypothetical protein
MKHLGWWVLAVLAALLLWHVDTWHTPNPTSRALLAISLVEDHSYQVDRFKEWTEDKALINGHYYSDKAPLASWLAAPVYALSTALSGKSSTSYPQHSAIYSGALVSGVIPALLFIALLWGALRRAEASPILSVLYIFAAVPCSMIGLYSGTFFGHVLGGILLVVAWKELFHGRRPLLAGLALGLASCAEFPLLLFVPFLALALLLRPSANRGRDLLSFALGLAPGALLIAGHNFLTTGSLSEFAYKHVDSPSFQHMKTLYGFKLPRLDALWGLTFSIAHGLLFHVPVLLVLAVASLRRRKPMIRQATMKAAAILAYLLLVSSYQMWEGGWAFGPRHLIPIAMVLLFEGTALMPAVFTKSWGWALGLSAGAGGALVFLAKATTLYMIPSQFRMPLLEVLLPKFLKGELNKNVLPTQLLGVSPYFSHLLWAHLLVFGALWLCQKGLVLEPSPLPTAEGSLQRTSSDPAT